MTVTSPTDALLAPLRDMPLAEQSVTTIRTLAMDGVQKASSGHPGTPMALAPVAYVLWQRFLKHHPANPHWPDRDRFVLSCGHASMLLYSLLHLTGYDLPLEELVRFRQLGSRTPGHPENDLTAGVETTTGPLGQGVTNAVGMAMAETHLAAVYNRPGHTVVDHRTWVLVSDGDLMEGISSEAASLAGHLGLGKLNVVYDDNHISIDGSTDLAFTEDVGARFEAYGWHVIRAGDVGNDLDALEAALAEARDESERPSLIVLRTHIGYGAPHKQDTASAHGEPLGEDEIRLAKRAYGWPEEAHFLVPPAVREHMDARPRGAAAEAEWRERFGAWKAAEPALAEQLDDALAGRLPEGWDDELPVFSAEAGSIATRAASGKVINAFAAKVPTLFGGSADLTGSTKNWMNGIGTFSREDRAGRNVHWGVREHAMAGICNGLALHGGLRPMAATFLIFTDYARPSIRLACLMELPVTYIMTHDSIGLGEDGPTHQPVEHLAALRAIPHMHLIRPADANETAWAWRAAMTRTDGPTLLVLTRQGLPILDQERYGRAEGVLKGGYVLSEADGDGLPDALLLATGSEVSIAMKAQAALAAEGIRARVVSLPCFERFRAQSQAYRDSVLPPSVTARVAIEAAVAQGWREWIGDRGAMIGMTTFGASAPAKQLFEHFGFGLDRVVATVKSLLG